jgi:ferrous iron transport protein A
MPTLADIEPNQRATIVAIEGEDEISLRLMEMGLIEGDEIQVIGRAPMGDPIEIAARGYRLSLRRAEAMRIQVFTSES